MKDNVKRAERQLLVNDRNMDDNEKFPQRENCQKFQRRARKHHILDTWKQYSFKDCWNTTIIHTIETNFNNNGIPFATILVTPK